MPILEAQLARAQKDLAAFGDAKPSMFYLFRRRRADQYHDRDTQLRGLKERVSHLQQRIAARNEQVELHAAAEALMQLSLHDLTQQIALPTHTSVPTAQT